MTGVDLQHLQIVDLERIVAELPAAERAVFERLYQVEPAIGRLVPPEHMQRWIAKYFGSYVASTW
jgi:hypothetical protein